MARIQISNDPSGQFIVFFPYDPALLTKRSKVIEIYAHVSTKSLRRMRSPLDNLNLERGDIDEV